MTNEITAWYDLNKRKKILDDEFDIYFYMIHSTHAEERKHWADAFLKKYTNSTNRFWNESDTETDTDKDNTF